MFCFSTEKFDQVLEDREAEKKQQLEARAAGDNIIPEAGREEMGGNGGSGGTESGNGGNSGEAGDPGTGGSSQPALACTIEI